MLTEQNLIYDEAENVVNSNIDKVKKNELDLKEALRICKKDKYVKEVYSNNLIDLIFSFKFAPSSAKVSGSSSSLML